MAITISELSGGGFKAAATQAPAGSSAAMYTYLFVDGVQIGYYNGGAILSPAPYTGAIGPHTVTRRTEYANPGLDPDYTESLDVTIPPPSPIPATMGTVLLPRPAHIPNTHKIGIQTDDGSRQLPPWNPNG